MAATGLDIPDELRNAAVVLGDRSEENPDQHHDDHDKEGKEKELGKEFEKRLSTLPRRHGDSIGKRSS